MKNKLPKKFKKKWVAALRSGKYQQGAYSLHDIGYYCCLGVACKVVGIPDSDIDQLSVIPLSTKKIPKMLRGSQDENALVEKLTEFNDGNGPKPPRSFQWIASYIERYL